MKNKTQATKEFYEFLSMATLTVIGVVTVYFSLPI